VKLGSGKFTYEPVVKWETLPPDYSWREVAAVAVDSNDNVYAFNRGDHPVIVFDKNGNFRKSWGEGGVFPRAHGITYGPDGFLYCTDDGDHTVKKCTLDGEVVMTLGVPGKPATPFSGQPFNRCTHVAFDPKTGDFYVSDGYANSRVHKYSPDGKLLFSWGAPGTEAGEFNIVHNIATDKDGYVYVCDRENHRVQVFDDKGKPEAIWANVHRPCAIYISDEQNVYVGELGPGLAVSKNTPNIGPRISVLNTKGERLAIIGHMGYGTAVGQMIAPHGICLDSEDSIYLGEVANTNMRNDGVEPPANLRSFQKFVKST
jgi:DNA-binding beta-propeller fold protein YncE